MTLVMEFWVPVLLFGCGLAIDLTIATLSKFNDRTITIPHWVLPLAVTHSVFPAASFWMFSQFDSQVFLGLAGFILIGLVVYEITTEAIGETPLISLSKQIGNLCNGNTLLGRRLAIILAVSWDALLSPAALTSYQWSTLQTIIACICFGSIAYIAAVSAMDITRRWRRKTFRKVHHVHTLSLINYFGTQCQITVLGSFGISSLWFAVTGSSNLLAALLISSVFFSFVLLLFSHRFWAEANNVARKTTKVQ